MTDIIFEPYVFNDARYANSQVKIHYENLSKEIQTVISSVETQIVWNDYYSNIPGLYTNRNVTIQTYKNRILRIIQKNSITQCSSIESIVKPNELYEAGTLEREILLKTMQYYFEHEELNRPVILYTDYHLDELPVFYSASDTTARSIKPQRGFDIAEIKLSNCKTIAELISCFEECYPDKIAFTNQAKSMSKKSCFSVKDLSPLFKSVISDLYPLLAKCQGEGDPYLLHKKKSTSFAFELEGSSTHGDSSKMRQFICEYDGEQIDTERHWTSKPCNGGKPESVHIGYSVKKKRIIVDRIGEHANTAGTDRGKGR